MKPARPDEQGIGLPAYESNDSRYAQSAGDGRGLVADTELSIDGAYFIQFASATAVRNPTIRHAWERLLDRRIDRGSPFQSPRFFEYLLDTGERTNLTLVLIFDRHRKLAGVIPVQITESGLEFTIGRWNLGSMKLRTLQLLGDAPLIPGDDRLYEGLFRLLNDRFPDCHATRMNEVARSSPLWAHIHRTTAARDYYPYVPFGVRYCHTSPLPPTFEEYMSQYGTKKRHNLKRQLKLLRAHGNGELQLVRVDSPEHLPWLFEAIDQIVPPTSSQRLMDHEVAQMVGASGHLLCYVLLCGKVPCAFTIGSRVRDVYLLHRTAYHAGFQKLSPGASLQLLLVEDLLNHSLATSIDFGYGEPSATFASTNVVVERGMLMLMRNGISNRLSTLLHAAFHSTIRLVKNAAEKSWVWPLLGLDEIVVYASFL